MSGFYKGFNAFITDAGAALYNGNYVFSYIAEMDMGADVSGQNGPPLLSVSSVTPVGSGVELPTYSIGNSQPEPAIKVPADTGAANSQTITSVEMFIHVDNSVVDITGYLKLRSNDPVWGNSFAGGINGKIKIPTEIQAGANMILGDKDGVKFWYFDAWFNDTQGQANAALWLATDESFLTGQTLQVNGGLTLRRNPSPKEINASTRAASAPKT